MTGHKESESVPEAIHKARDTRVVLDVSIGVRCVR